MYFLLLKLLLKSDPVVRMKMVIFLVKINKWSKKLIKCLFNFKVQSYVSKKWDLTCDVYCAILILKILVFLSDIPHIFLGNLNMYDYSVKAEQKYGKGKVSSGNRKISVYLQSQCAYVTDSTLLYFLKFNENNEVLWKTHCFSKNLLKNMKCRNPHVVGMFNNLGF